MTETTTQHVPVASSPLAALVTVAVALGLTRVATRMLGLVVLGGIVLGTVLALAVGILVLKLTLS